MKERVTIKYLLQDADRCFIIFFRGAIQKVLGEVIEKNIACAQIFGYKLFNISGSLRAHSK